MPSFTSVVPPETVHDLGTVDYLVVGAGAASMAFIDTLLKSQPKLKIAIVDKNDRPGLPRLGYYFSVVCKVLIVLLR